MNFINDFDILILTETWHSKTSNINIDGYCHFSCPRPKFNSNARRNSSGVIIYYKTTYFNHIELVNVNQNGIIWFKLKKEFLLTENDAYFCSLYIPPESSTLYKNVKSSLFEFDFFQHLSNEIRHYSSLGDVYIQGDTNCRTGL